MLFAMYSEHFRRDIVHPFDMGCWHCWRHLWLCHRIDMLLCGKCSYLHFHFLLFNRKEKETKTTFFSFLALLYMSTTWLQSL